MKPPTLGALSAFCNWTSQRKVVLEQAGQTHAAEQQHAAHSQRLCNRPEIGKGSPANINSSTGIMKRPRRRSKITFAQTRPHRPAHIVDGVVGGTRLAAKSLGSCESNATIKSTAAAPRTMPMTSLRPCDCCCGASCEPYGKSSVQRLAFKGKVAKRKTTDCLVRAPIV